MKLLLLLSIVVACSASLTKRDCGADPDDCQTDFFDWDTCKNPQNVSEEQGIDQDVLDNLHFFSQFAAAAYWPDNNNSTGDLLKCSGDNCSKVPAGNCPDVEKGEYTTVQEWKDVDKSDDHGFIAISQNDQIIVLAFRGSRSQQNWGEDLKLGKADVPEFCECCWVHQGFWESWRGVSKAIMDVLIKLHHDNPDYRIAITGHSLGGAQAIIAAGEIRTLGSWWADNVELYSYGSPRIGNTETVRFLTEQSSKSYRVTATKDPIPRLPLTSMGYQHTSPEYWIHSNPDDPGPDDINVLGGFFNPKGVNKFGFLVVGGFEMEDHRHYFGYISGCDPDPPKDPSWTDFSGPP